MARIRCQIPALIIIFAGKGRLDFWDSGVTVLETGSENGFLAPVFE